MAASIGEPLQATAGQPVAEIGTEDVLGVLKPLWATKTVTAARTRERMEQVLDAAKAKGYRTGDNPARWKGNLKASAGDAAPRRDPSQGDPVSPMFPPFMAKLRAWRVLVARRWSLPS